MSRKTVFSGLIVFGLVLVFVSANYWKSRMIFNTFYFDLTNNNSHVKNANDMRKVLSKFEKTSFLNLDKAYRIDTDSESPKFVADLKGRSYYTINSSELYRFIVGNVRIYELLPKDKYFKEAVVGARDKVYWLVDVKVLEKLLLLQNTLFDSGYDGYAFQIRNGYRHPAYNRKVGGASQSRHIRGEAIDFKVQDVNIDGSVSKADKKIVLDLLEQKIIVNEGGIGRYPNTMSIHIDTRGHRARWDSY